MLLGLSLTILYSKTFQGRLLYIENSVLFLDRNISIGWVTSVIRCAFLLLFVSNFAVSIWFLFLISSLFKFPYLIKNIAVFLMIMTMLDLEIWIKVMFAFCLWAKYLCIRDLCFFTWTRQIHYYNRGAW